MHHCFGDVDLFRVMFRCEVRPALLIFVVCLFFDVTAGGVDIGYCSVGLGRLEYTLENHCNTSMCFVLCYVVLEAHLAYLSRNIFLRRHRGGDVRVRRLRAAARVALNICSAQ